MNSRERWRSSMHACMHVAGEQINAGQQTQRAMALVLMIASEGRVRPWLWRQVGGGAADCLDVRLLIMRNDRDIRCTGVAVAQHRDFGIDAELQPSSPRTPRRAAPDKIA